jgi:hypothetical protein
LWYAAEAYALEADLKDEEMRMNRTHAVPTLLILFSIAFLLVACEDASDQDETLNAELSRVTPSNGSTDIDPDAEVTVEFTEGMDTNSCEARFGVYMGELDEIPINMMGQMTGMISGQFHWNDDQTMMTFHPDSSLMDSTMYSICLQEGMEMHHHGEEKMMGQGHMQGHGNAAGEGIIVHFRTGRHIP